MFVAVKKKIAIKMIISSSNFLVSSSNVRQCPKSDMPEFAFIGRSNVGKSSLINMLCQHRIAKVSGTPGKTQLINHFVINNTWHLVDLPGYGYARVSKSAKSKFQQLITDYVLRREELTLLFVLIDIRHEPQKIDLEFMRFLGENGVPFSIIFTKADKLKDEDDIAQHVGDYSAVMLEEWEEMPTYFISSSSRIRGKEEILDYIEEVINSVNQ